MHAKYSKGFTLIELMVVIAVVTILAIAAAPTYTALLDRYRVNKAAEDVISVISNARAGSMKLHRQVNVKVATGANWCVGANAATLPTSGAKAGSANACSCATPSGCSVEGEQLVIPAGRHAGVSLTNASSGLTGTGLVFDGMVGATTSLASQSLSLQSPRGMFTVAITVTPLGQANTTITQN